MERVCYLLYCIQRLHVLGIKVKCLVMLVAICIVYTIGHGNLRNVML